MKVTAIIAAGGRGTRFGADRPKQLVEVNGRPILERSVRAFQTHERITEVIVALPGDLLDPPPPYLESIRIVEGGVRRQDSVANAFRAADPESEVIVIHDAARPFVTSDLISRTVDAAAEHGAALAAIAARDTVKRIRRPEGLHHHALEVEETIARELVYLAQTPQAFRRGVLASALALPHDATDEAALAERAGHVVRVVEGDAANIKITTQDDLRVAEALARGGERPARTGRAGTGYDLHRLVEGRPLVVGGVTIASDRGPLGHSDGDVACHAVIDAILGAASLGDIGRHFPDDDPRWKGANSLDLLARAVELIHTRGLEVGNVDVTVVLERPKIRDHIDTMRACIARALGVTVDRVSIKGKTNEGVDAIGRGEAIAAHAVALVRSR